MTQGLWASIQAAVSLDNLMMETTVFLYVVIEQLVLLLFDFPGFNFLYSYKGPYEVVWLEETFSVC